jgi:uncharacterized membrane protein (DUF2068 family)
LKKRAPTLYVIVAIKLGKGLLLFLLACGVYSLSDTNLPEELTRLLEALRLDPEQKFFATLLDRVAQITAANVRWIATGTLAYAVLLLVEGLGLVFRARWACWLAIGEGAFFIPLEVHRLVERYSHAMFGILLVNSLIVWYLYRNRHRLFDRQVFQDALPAAPGERPRTVADPGPGAAAPNPGQPAPAAEGGLPLPR